MAIKYPQVKKVVNHVVSEGTPAQYSARILDSRYVIYKGSGKECVFLDSRFPMSIVPIMYEGDIGYAYYNLSNEHMDRQCDRVIDAGNSLDYWMFYKIANGKLLFYPDALASVIWEHKLTFTDVDFTDYKAVVNSKFDTLLGSDRTYQFQRDMSHMYKSFFELHDRLFRVMSVDWSTGLVVALSESGRQVLLMAAHGFETDASYSKYMTFIPIKDGYGLAVIGLSSSDVNSIEEELTPWYEDL